MGQHPTSNLPVPAAAAVTPITLLHPSLPYPRAHEEDTTQASHPIAKHYYSLSATNPALFKHQAQLLSLALPSLLSLFLLLSSSFFSSSCCLNFACWCCCVLPRLLPLPCLLLPLLRSLMSLVTTLPATTTLILSITNLKWQEKEK